MDFLLWIALIGVIVFLLGLIYSRLVPSAGKKPAKNTIAPATETATKQSTVAAPAPVKTEPQAKAAAAPVSTKATAEPVTVAQLAANAPKPAAPSAKQMQTPKTVPQAEPVGPDFNKNNTKAVAATKPQVQPQAPVQSPIQTDAVDAQALPASEPAIITEPKPVEPSRLTAPRNGQADALTRIEGIGTAIETRLFRLGIFHYDQLADLSVLQTDWLNAAIGFAGRVERENWSAQAKKLAAKQTVAKQAESAKPAAKSAKASKTSAPAKAKTAAKPKPRKVTAKAE